MEEKCKIVFQPSGKTGYIRKGLSLLEAAREVGVDINTHCGGVGVCGKCKVLIEDGKFIKFGIESAPNHVTPWQDAEANFITNEEKQRGFRLACKASVIGDVLVFVPEESRASEQIVSKTAGEITVEKDPAVKLLYVELDPPQIEDPQGDFERLCDCLKTEYGLNHLSIDFLALQHMPKMLRAYDWKVTVSIWNEKEIIRITPGIRTRYYGMAIDIGTTTVAVYTCDLSANRIIDTRFFMNPQCKYGEDVMSRITYDLTNSNGFHKMRSDLYDSLNNAINSAICANQSKSSSDVNSHGAHIRRKDVQEKREGDDTSDFSSLSHEDIEDVVIVGNTVMHHIFANLTLKFLGRSPFGPVVHRSLNIKARDLGLNVNASAYVHLLPIEAGYVGADNVAVLISEKPHKRKGVQLIIDIGTNSELILRNRNRIFVSSCASGPAFEGAQITHGMKASPGAIESVRVIEETHEIDYKVIGKDTWRSTTKVEDLRCKGICGSGILEVVAEFFKAGIINSSGAFVQHQKSRRFRINPDTGMKEFVIAWAKETSFHHDIIVTQKDVRQVQMAKAAIYSGCKLMMKKAGVHRLDEVKIAGAFGNHIDKERALIVGLFPDIALESVSCIGNAAGDGAIRALLCRKERIEAERIAKRTEYIELAAEAAFMEEFMEAIDLPHSKDLFPHLRDILPTHLLPPENSSSDLTFSNRSRRAVMNNKSGL